PALLEFTILLSDSCHLGNDIIYIENHLHHADLLIIDSLVKFFLHLRLAYVINLKSKLDSCQWTCESRISCCNSLSCKTCSLALCSSENYNKVLRAVLVSKLLYSLLVFQIHCACARSDEALRGREYHFPASRL